MTSLNGHPAHPMVSDQIEAVPICESARGPRYYLKRTLLKKLSLREILGIMLRCAVVVSIVDLQKRLRRKQSHVQALQEKSASQFVGRLPTFDWTRVGRRTPWRPATLEVL
jgi:hypothetical protein